MGDSLTRSFFLYWASEYTAEEYPTLATFLIYSLDFFFLDPAISLYLLLFASPLNLTL